MKPTIKLIAGIVLTAAIFLIATFTIQSKIPGDFFPDSFITHSAMLVLSIALIIIFYQLGMIKFPMKKFSFLTGFKAFGFTIIIVLVINILISIIINATGGDITEKHFAFKTMSPLQILIFIFFYASIAEEFLFRGFLLNFISNSNIIMFRILRRVITLPVIICALMFGAGHLVLLSTGAGLDFMIRILITTTILGFLAGYFQEKYRNFFLALIVHMTGNLPGVIMSLVS